MIVLGVDTATPGLSVALIGPAGTAASRSFDAGRRHTELLAPAIDELCRDTGIDLAEIDGFAVDVGPGLFTGLRVGLATVSALSSALRRPAVGLLSTEILAEPHRRAGHDVVAVVDVRRSEVAWAHYPAETPSEIERRSEIETPGEIGRRGEIERPSETERPSEPTPRLATPEELREHLAGIAGHRSVVVVGDGAARYRELLAEIDGLVIDIAMPYPSAEVAATLARDRLAGGSPPALAAARPRPIAPVYLRPADVRIGWATHERATIQAPTPAAPDQVGSGRERR